MNSLPLPSSSREHRLRLVCSLSLLSCCLPHCSSAERDKELTRLKKEEEAKRLERLWNENQRNLIAKQREREKQSEQERKYVKELDEKFQREEERRQAEVARKASCNSTDRSAFLLAQVSPPPPPLTHFTSHFCPHFISLPSMVCCVPLESGGGVQTEARGAAVFYHPL
jgi:hypothetical protein